MNEHIRKIVFVMISTVFLCSLSAETRGSAGRITPKNVAYDVYMLGIDTREKLETIRSAVRRTPTIALVSYSGLAPTLHPGQNIDYITGPAASNGRHDDHQMSRVFSIIKHLGFKVNVKVFRILMRAQIPEIFRQAGECADIVITYYSYWHNEKADVNVPAMLASVAGCPDTLYIAPYGEIANCPPTNMSFQAGARHADGTGVRNFITTIPLAKNSNGNLLTPSARDENDTETANFVAPTSYAGSLGDTCPSAGMTLAIAAYIVASAEEEDITAHQIISLMRDNVSFPAERMLSTTYFSETSINNLRDNLNRMINPDKFGIRRLEGCGVLDLWRIHQAMYPEK